MRTLVVIPTFNSEKTIKRTLDSIFAQTVDVVVIVSDDASTDNTLDIIRQYRVLVCVNVKNQGPSQMRNDAIAYGLQHCENIGSIAYCDSDDWWEPDHLEKGLARMKLENADMVYSPAKCINLAGQVIDFPVFIPNDYDAEVLKKHNYIWPSSVIQKPVMAAPFDSTVDALEDWDMWLCMAEAGWKIVREPSCTLNYQVSNNSFGKNGSKVWDKVLAKHAKFVSTPPVTIKQTIVIPTCKSENFIPCRNSILKNTDLSNTQIVVVANGYNGSPDDFKGMDAVWFDERIGYTKAVNQGIKRAKGEFVILLNDDTTVLDWGKNAWIDMLTAPFVDEKVGVTGPVKDCWHEINRNFIIFFCVCIRRKLFDELGLLDEIFNPGGGEDADFCIKAENAGHKIVQVPSEQKELQGGQWVTRFPLYHAAEKTVFDIPDWAGVFAGHGQILKKRYGLPDGHFYPGDIQEYSKLLEQVPDGGTCGELGTAYGRSMCSVADIIKRKNLRMIAVDTFKGTENEKTPDGKWVGWDSTDYKQAFIDNLARFGIKAEIHQGFTNDVAKEIPDETFDLLFIDADHSYESVRQDIDNWRPKMKKTGLMCGHDYGGTFTGVTKAVDETFPRIERGGYMWAEKKGNHISVSICTRGRYHTTLPLAMASLISQTRRPDQVYIYDDTPQDEFVDIMQDPVIKNILETYKQLGIGWYIMYGLKKGASFGDQECNRISKDLVFRFDDDCILEANVLEELEKAMTSDVGAVGCSIFNPLAPQTGTATGKLVNIKREPNMQWVGGQGDVEHLYSCFLYRAHVADWDLNLSPRSFRGETMFTHEIMRKKYKLKVINSAKIWHYQNGSGGCRAVISEQDNLAMYNRDEKVFDGWMMALGGKFFHLDNGLGDHIVFRKLLDDLGIKDATIACCYPDVFRGTNFRLISIKQSVGMGCMPIQHNIYAWMALRKWNRSLYAAYKEMYNL